MNSYFNNILIELPQKSPGIAHVHITTLANDFNTERINDILKDWNIIGNNGGFCHPQGLPEHAGTSLEFAGLQADNNYDWRVSLRNCDNRCLIILANIIVDAGYMWEPDSEIIRSIYDRIEIRADSVNSELQRYDFDTEEFEFNDQYYPQISDVLRPLVIFEGTSIVNAFRRAIIELRTSSAEDRFDQINEIVDLWSRVAQYGYTPSLEGLYNGNGAIQGVSFDLFDENSLELKIETFGGTESAWNSLINLLGRFRSEITCIKVY